MIHFKIYIACYNRIGLLNLIWFFVSEWIFIWSFDYILMNPNFYSQKKLGLWGWFFIWKSLWILSLSKILNLLSIDIILQVYQFKSELFNIYVKLFSAYCIKRLNIFRGIYVKKSLIHFEIWREFYKRDK